MIDLLPNADQEEISNAVADFLANELPLARLRRVHRAERNRDRDRWRQMGELGFFGLGLEATSGGVGYSLIEEILAFREFGRFAVSPAVLATVVGARLAASAEYNSLVQSLLAGEAFVGLALPWHYLGEAESGSSCYLVDGDLADHVLFWTSAGAALWRTEDLVSVEPVEPLDSSLAFSQATLSRPCVIPVGGLDRIAGLRATLLTAAMMVGVAEAARDASVDYAKLREQFGQPIGSFQAVKHRCSDMAVRAEVAWSQARFAALALHEARSDVAFQVSAAKLLAGAAAVKNAQANIQNHGAIAMTAEIDAHLLLKRAHLLDRLGGDQREHRTLLMREAAPS